MKRSFFLGSLLLFLFLCSCATELPLLMVGNPGEVVPEEWKGYGAYYEYDELRIYTEDLNPDLGWSSYYIVNQKIHILNRKGLSFATLSVPKYSDVIAVFEVTLWDPSGNKVPLDQEALKKKYYKSGKIIVPKAEPGCQIGIKIKFGELNLIYSHEHWFEEPIPVLNARFSVFYPRNVKYECKPYGGVSPVELQSSGIFVGYVWNQKNILPEDDVFEYRWHIDREPHVMARIKYWYWQEYNYDAPDWNGLARKTGTFFLSPSIFTLKSRLKKIALSASKGQAGAFEKADAILSYVQNEITLDSKKEIKLDAIDLNKVVREKSGNRFEIAVLLKELFKAAGFSTRIYITRPQSWGGFDPDFPSWRYIAYPLVAVDINGRELVAFPYNRLMALGEYPFIFHDLQALEIDNGKTAFLPKSTYSDPKRTSLVTLSPRNWQAPQPWLFNYSGEFATFIRNELDSRTADRRKDYFRSVIHGYDKGNKLEKADLGTIERKGEIKVTLGCRNADYRTQRDDLSHYSLKPWFRKYFTDYDKTRKANYTNDMAVVYEDDVLIKKDNHARLSYHFECVKLDNPLFSSRCRQKETREGMLLSRVLTVKQTDLNHEQMQSIYPDIEKLNRIDESFIIERP